MTLREKLDRLRDEKAFVFSTNLVMNNKSMGFDKSSANTGYRNGFTSAQDLLLPLIEKMKLALQECSYFCQDQIARTNKAIEADCPDCDYQCVACIQSIDDCESTKKKIREALSELKKLEEGFGK